MTSKRIWKAGGFSSLPYATGKTAFVDLISAIPFWEIVPQTLPKETSNLACSLTLRTSGAFQLWAGQPAAGMTLVLDQLTHAGRPASNR